MACHRELAVHEPRESALAGALHARHPDDEARLRVHAIPPGGIPLRDGGSERGEYSPPLPGRPGKLAPARERDTPAAAPSLASPAAPLGRAALTAGASRYARCRARAGPARDELDAPATRPL